MKKYSLMFLLLLSGCCCVAHAQDSFRATIVSSDCVVISKSGSVTGAAVGGTAGAVVGGIVGSALFGRGWGRAMSTAAGAVVGGAAGENLAASRTYSCFIRAETADKVVLAETTGRLRNTGEQVLVTRLSDGSYSIR